MKQTAVLLLVLLTSVAVAHTPHRTAVKFSGHTPSLTRASFDAHTGTYMFAGSVSLTGTLFVEFDMGGPHQALGNITFEKFVPDKAQRARLPAVIAGPFANPVKFLSLDATRQQLAAVFGGKQAFERISHGRTHSVSRRVQVQLDHYATLVECDARSYRAHVVSITPTPASRTVSGHSPPAGC